MSNGTRRAPYDPSQRAEILELVGDPQMRAGLWAWQFERNPRGVAFDPVVLVNPKGSVIGFNGTMPVQVHYDGLDRTACWSCDFHVRADQRRSGVGRRVKQELHADHPLLMTFGVSPTAAKVLPRLGWRQNTEVHSFRRHQRAVGLRNAPRVGLQMINRLRQLHWRSGQESTQHLQIDFSEQLPPASEVDGLWRRVGTGYRKIVRRDFPYLSWRYEQCPVANYEFMTLRDGGELRGLGVLRRSDRTSKLVDLVAESGDAGARLALVNEWLTKHPDVTLHETTSSDPLLAQVLESEGFARPRSQPGFYVRSELGDPEPERGWFIMPGDSDGDFLGAARERRHGSDEAATSLSVRRLDIEQMMQDPAPWNALMARANADPLFMGWAWQSAWWETWGKSLALEPNLLGVYLGSDLVGLLPAFIHRRDRLGFSTSEIQLLGNAWRIAPTVRTEYVDLIADRTLRKPVARAIHTYLQSNSDWDLITFCDHVFEDRPPRPPFEDDAEMVVRKIEPGTRIDTTGTFTAWLQQLGRNTRLKAFNRRRYLGARGSLQLRDEPDIDKALTLLNHFHLKRWGKPCFSGASLDFHRRFLSRQHPDREVRFTVLEFDGVPISILYDVKVAHRVYNLQAGFDDAFDPKVSPGTLHLGYAIEAAFEDSAISSYDLLAGPGKNEFYKGRFHGERVEFVTFQLVRNPVLRKALTWYFR